MIVEKNIRFNYKSNLYSLDNGPWLVAWDEINGVKINEFGFRIGDPELYNLEVYAGVPIAAISIPDSPIYYESIITNTTALLYIPSHVAFQSVFTTELGYSYIVTMKIIIEVITDLEYDCSDINGDIVNKFILSDNGVVYGYDSVTNEGGATIGVDCCTSLGYEFDPVTALCLWSRPCEDEDIIKVIINPYGDDGVIFQVDDDSTCVLDIEFNYLLEYDCESLIQCSQNKPILDIFKDVTVAMSLERVIPNLNPDPNIEFQSPFTLDSIYSEIIYDGSKFNDYLDNEDTGVFLNGDDCQSVVNMVQNQLPNSSFNANSLFSGWMTFKVSITDESLLTQIKNEKLKLALIITDSTCDMSILIDNVNLLRICNTTGLEKTFVTNNPSFNLERIVDNKKSWVAKEEFDERVFDLSRRETNYNINHHKLGVNSKELDLSVTPSMAIEVDVKNVIDNIDCLLDEHNGVNISDLLTTELNSEMAISQFKDIILSELIDVKSRKTLSDYPTLHLIYERYLNAMGICGVETNQYTYDHMTNFIKLIGNYWVGLVEQVIPSTTIWGSTYKYNNTLFDNNKYKYKKGSLISCNSLNPINVIANNPTIQVISEDISISVETRQATEKCSGVYMSRIFDGSEFTGSVQVIGDSSRDFIDDGDIIILNESLGS